MRHDVIQALDDCVTLCDTDGVSQMPSTVGRFLLRALRSIGRGVATGYRAVDPAARRHLAEMPVLGLTLVARRHVPVEPIPDDGHRPVVFVHGLGGHRGNFLPMQSWFRLWGRRRLYSIGYPAGATVEGIADHLRAVIDQVVEVNELGDNGQVDVVAHSMGGLVARVALEAPETVDRVATLVTLGTPHGGTYAAKYAATIHTLSLRHGSELLEGIAHQIPWARTLPRLVCFWSQDDLMLFPPTTACVDGAELCEMPGFTHLTYLLHPRCFQGVLEALDPPTLTALPAPVRSVEATA